ncbi:NAD(P)-binding Rossmann-fold superfamily protein [Tanacetum coccineum]
MKNKMLIIGGTGYLGQHLLQSYSDSLDLSIAFTYHSFNPPDILLQAVPNAIPFKVDLQTGHGFDSVSHTFGQLWNDLEMAKCVAIYDGTAYNVLEYNDLLGSTAREVNKKNWSCKIGWDCILDLPDVVVNCAALSIPRACETDPSLAMSVNVPSSLVKWLSSFPESNTLLIHLSTDQVYEGTSSYYKEENETLPVNVYGKSKVAAEEYISSNWPNFAILRSSIIFGPQTISPVPKSLPIQWMDSVLAKGQQTDFFHDEFRCPVYVKDVVNIIQILSNRCISDGKKMQLLLNVGGPDRLSRVQMAEVVARVRGYDASLIKQVSASSVSGP